MKAKSNLVNMKPLLLLVFLFLFFSSCARSTANIEVIGEREITQIIKVEATPLPIDLFIETFPSGDPPDYESVDCASMMISDINNCAYARAYDSARELDALLDELNNQYPGGEWQSILGMGSALIPQQEWESLKDPYCEYDVHLAYGGREHTSYFWDCINRENQKRTEFLTSVACHNLPDFLGECQ